MDQAEKSILWQVYKSVFYSCHCQFNNCPLTMKYKSQFLGGGGLQGQSFVT
jgi:hypothetical protein